MRFPESKANSVGQISKKIELKMVCTRNALPLKMKTYFQLKIAKPPSIQGRGGGAGGGLMVYMPLLKEIMPLFFPFCAL